MILKSVRLKNIRTYENEVIEFKTGSTLLAGDIGSGKSSVLLSAEFALFGFQKGEITGVDLLRHGASNGSVEASFEINGSSISVCRALKREKKGIVQETGFVEIDGRREPKSPTEIRAAVINLLNYPQEYMTKNPIVFRYTVYTPQDEMKKILFSDSEERLKIIRKLFDIDKYGRIRENVSNIALKELRALKRECEIQFSDIDAKTREKEERKKQKAQLNQSLDRTRVDLFEIEKKLDSTEKEFEILSESIRNLSALSQEFARKKTLSEQKRLRLNSASNEIASLGKRLDEIKAVLDRPLAKPDYDERTLIDKQKEYETEKSRHTSSLGFLENEIRRLQTVLTKGICDFCGQRVSNASEFMGKVDEKTRLLSEAREKIALINGKLREIEEMKRAATNYNSEILVRKEKERQYLEYKKRKDELELEKNSVSKELVEIDLSIARLVKDLSGLAELENRNRTIRSEISFTRSKRDELSMQAARLEQQIDHTAKDIDLLESQIVEKQRLKERHGKLGGMIGWFDTVFMPLTETIEKHVLSAMQNEFNQFFQHWFDVLIPDQTITVSVDDSFSPIIEQAGYQTEYQNLSGGEKTSVALAYRLALNRVINSMVDSIKTKDIIILDEPTDGFSTDQLDRIRDVLNELNLKQMIIVSHEPKIDTYVDNVIRFYKENNISKVVGN